MSVDGDQWYEDESGRSVVRPYAVTRGRTRGPAESVLDLIALVVAKTRSVVDEQALDKHGLSPEHQDILEMCRAEPMSVAEIAAGTGLLLGVVRVLVGDLVDAGLVRVSRPVPPAQLPDERILREVISGLRAL